MIVYDVFAGPPDGGPVDYSAPVLTTAGLTATVPAVPPDSRTRFAVRARDTLTGLSCGNTDAAVLVVASAGLDVTGAPPPPQSLRAFPGSNGTAVAEWAWPYPASAPPDGFRVYLWPAARPALAWSAPAAVVPYTGGAGRGRFFARVTLAGLLDGVGYRVGVRAFNGSGEDQNTAHVGVSGRPADPPAVASLAAAAGY